MNQEALFVDDPGFAENRGARDRHTGRIEELGVEFPDPNFTPEIPCSLWSEELAGAEF